MECPGAPKFETLEAKFDVLCEKLDGMIEAVATQSNTHLKFYQWLIKALLTVVCIIALGQRALDALPQITGAVAESFQAKK